MAKRWMVLAVARPEVLDRFPNLWADRNIHEIQLTRITKRASEQFVRQALGDGASAETAQRLIALADGNPFYLQELTRAAALHSEKGLPATIIAVVQSNLATRDPEDRRILRAASVFGEVFWLGGVSALLGGAEQVAHVQSRLLNLVELIVRQSESRFAGEVEFAFRDILLREAAYTMLTTDDRVLGHRLAREWLRSRGGDPAG